MPGSIATEPPDPQTIQKYATIVKPMTVNSSLTTSNFEQILQKLNEAQRQVVENIDGPLMVIAGPGTGKTMVLTARIANILGQTDTKPHNILALTFTESAATTMRRRLVDMIGSDGYYVRIETFHAFCSQIIKDHPEYFSIERGSQPLTDLERYALFEQILLDLKLEIIKPINQPLFYLKECMKGISDLKREGFLPIDFQLLLEKEKEVLQNPQEELKKTELLKRQKNLSKQFELLEVYKEYQKRLRENLRYDFDDMIMLVLEAFEQEEMLLREYQEEIHYFLVDEYQDTNAAQNKVVDLLASYWGDRANLFVVGDPHQSIYRFQGASMENMLGFIKRHPGAAIINLETGYRCTQLIYSAANQLISQNSLTQVSEQLSPVLNQVLKSPKPDGAKIQVYEAPSQIVELMAVGQKIADLIEAGVNPEEIAVLYRHNADVLELQQVLDHLGIRYEIEGGGNVLDSDQIRQLITLLKVIHQLRQGESADEIFDTMCFDWTSFDCSLAMRVARAASKAQLPIVDLLLSGFEKFAEYHIGPEVSEDDFVKSLNFVENLYSWGILDSQMIFPEWFEHVIDQSGYLDWLLAQDNKVELLTQLNALYKEIKSLAQSNRELNLGSFLESLELMYEHNIWLEAEDLNITENAIRLATAHKAKGQEWQHVFIIHCLDKKWGNVSRRELLPLPESLLANTQIDQKERNEDERRLFFVALTRASQQLYITYPQTLVSASKSKSVVGSMFISEIENYCDRVPSLNTDSDSSFDLNNSAKLISALIRPVSTMPITKSDEDYFRALVDRLSLSSTALNKYLRDPYEFVLDSLIRVPRAKPEYMAYGTAVHQALEYLFGKIMQNQTKPDLELVLRKYHSALEKELLISLDFERRLEHGRAVLTKYWHNLDESRTRPLFIERSFGSSGSKTMLGNINLTGRIDRVDWIDKKAKTVRVIDYKTGTSKSDNLIKGLTKSANLSERELELPESVRGPYYRQLVFYKLLCQLDPSFIPEVVEAEFDFVEPDKTSGKFVKRVFTISNDEVEDLKNLIKEVMKEIRSLQFIEYIKQN